MILIYKYELTSNTTSFIRMPGDAKILQVGVQPGEYDEVVVVWAEVDTTKPIVTRKFALYPTGYPFLPEHICGSSDYVGTVRISPDNLIFHIYDLGEE